MKKTTKKGGSDLGSLDQNKAESVRFFIEWFNNDSHFDDAEKTRNPYPEDQVMQIADILELGALLDTIMDDNPLLEKRLDYNVQSGGSKSKLMCAGVGLFVVLVSSVLGGM
ncbi:hypothetical protein TetV_511 [Tetraselmis virus 1]|uniref:Uncharacterized protein n=1 Tax=Tetraselmis virus 1 TaxID=2060617 RepID=A0A2P0VNW4_9VIRU|nr:hypothetical protein QJ968_gp543 [Tetraselmis virus 1]AUF82593.1 hypothetical protein TetV_511 [Tetraselmis virus 1]